MSEEHDEDGPYPPTPNILLGEDEKARIRSDDEKDTSSAGGQREEETPEAAGESAPDDRSERAEGAEENEDSKENYDTDHEEWQGFWFHATNGDSFWGGKTHNQAGRDIYINMPFSTRTADDYIEYTGEDLDHILARYVESPRHDRLVQALRERRVIAMSGEPGTGRTTTAIAAIRERYENVGRVSARITPADIDKERLKSGHGYVLDATYASWAHGFDAADLHSLSGKLRDQHSGLVIIVGAGTLTDPVSAPYVIEHAAPDSWGVVCSHLGDEFTCLDDVRQDEVRKRFGDARLPDRPRRLAQAAKDYTHEDRGFVLDADRLEEMARQCLIKPPEMSHEDWIGCRSFLIAWAVLDGLPAAKVCEAAVDMADRLHRAERPDKYRRDRQVSDWMDTRPADAPKMLRRAPLTERFGRWFSYVSEADGARPPEEDSEAAQRRLKFHNPEFGTALLRVLWRDHPVVRAPLMHWMNDHLHGETVDVQRRIALAVGAFASEDFAFVKLSYLNTWVADKQAVRHNVVALALKEASRINRALKSETSDIIRDWAMGGVTRRSTAVRAYSTEIGSDDPERALRDLRRIGVTSYDKLGNVVSASVADLFLRGVHVPVAEALIEWTASGDHALEQIAAEALRRIAMRRDPETGRLPAMLAVSERDHRAADAIAELWRAVLERRGAGNEHWRVLRDWSCIVPRPRAVDHLITRLLESEELRPRLRFKLARIPAAVS